MVGLVVGPSITTKWNSGALLQRKSRNSSPRDLALSTTLSSSLPILGRRPREREKSFRLPAKLITTFNLKKTRKRKNILDGITPLVERRSSLRDVTPLVERRSSLRDVTSSHREENRHVVTLIYLMRFMKY